MEFKDISMEAKRVYILENGMYAITAPVKLYVATSGSHRVESADGKLHYIPRFCAIEITLKDPGTGWSF